MPREIGLNTSSVREYEILRVSATVQGDDFLKVAESARKEVLAWAQNRCGGRLPPEAWSLSHFDYLAGGRNSAGVRIETENSDVWAIRADDPDKVVPGRIWTTEVVVGLLQGQAPKFSARLLVNTNEATLSIEPHTPGFVQQVVDVCGLVRNKYPLSYIPTSIEDKNDIEQLIDMLTDPVRALPAFVLTAPDDAKRPLLDADILSRATLGMAHVIVVSAEATWALSERFQRVRSVFGGAARAYLPGFNEESNLYDHRLFLADQLASAEGQGRCARWMRQIAAAESLRTNRLSVDVLSFSAIRNTSLRVRQEQLKATGASESERLVAADARIQALEKDVTEERSLQEYFSSEAKKAEERATSAEAQHRASVYRIQQLSDQLKAAGTDPDQAIAQPIHWAELSNWCDVNLAGKLALAPAARRGVRSPDFEDFSLVTRCLTWLANDYRSGRLTGAEGGFRDFSLEPGIRNSPCGGDEFDFEWQGRQQTADWHIKNGGNTRDPRRCLRIYYFWDADTGQVIVADMPAHRDSAVS